MSNLVQPRDPDELEGSLLPVATAVATNDDGGRAGVPFRDDDTVPVTAATPVSYFAYPDNEDDNSLTEQQNGQFIREVPAVPLVQYSARMEQQSADVEEEQIRRQLRQAARTGRIDNNTQIQDIRKTNRQVPAMNYFTRRQIQEANRRARWLSQQENRQGWQGPKSELATPKAVASSSLTSAKTNESDAQQGTFGKEYEVGQYDIKEYDTKDYQISEYKSLYES